MIEILGPAQGPNDGQFIAANGDVYDITQPDCVLRFVGHDPNCRSDEGDPPGAKRYDGLVWPMIREVTE